MCRQRSGTRLTTGLRHTAGKMSQGKSMSSSTPERRTGFFIEAGFYQTSASSRFRDSNNLWNPFSGVCHLCSLLSNCCSSDSEPCKRRESKVLSGVQPNINPVTSPHAEAPYYSSSGCYAIALLYDALNSYFFLFFSVCILILEREENYIKTNRKAKKKPKQNC